jgi:NAD(P)-dependent dehydrogenase (short-subunit alcohol dehydrogenase family)
MKIHNVTALVTGANRGIGSAFVQALLKAGAKKVYATARKLDSLSAVTALDPARVIPLQVDVTNSKSIAALAERTRDVTLLINNAGILAFGNILEVPTDTISSQFDTNFYGTLNSMPGLSVYNASKAATWSLTQSLRASVAAKGIAVYGVFPGAVDTDMLAGVDMAKTSPADIATGVLTGIESGQEDIFPDPMSTQLYAAWKQDHKAVEKQFATM